MNRKRKPRKDNNEEDVSQILKGKACPAFYFFTDIGCYTGESANSLMDFRDKIEDVKVKSVESYCSRGDFRL